MKSLRIRWALPGLITISALGLMASPAFSKQEAKLKSKSSQKSDSKKAESREAGELPSGLERYSERKGTLPSGLQKKKDVDGTLTPGLDEGGKKLNSTSKGKRISKQ